MPEATTLAQAVRAAAERGDYGRAVETAAKLVPGMEPQLGQYQYQMERYEQYKAAADWRHALRALADARTAAVAAGLPELETVASNRLYEVVKLYSVRAG